MKAAIAVAGVGKTSEKHHATRQRRSLKQIVTVLP